MPEDEDEDDQYPAVPWAEYVPKVTTSLQSLLSTEPEEPDVQAFLESHPALLPGALGDIGPRGQARPAPRCCFQAGPAPRTSCQSPS
jgi:hypothetical protein